MPLKRYGTCSVCLEEMVGYRTVRRTRCGHVFHAACMDRWRVARDPEGAGREIPCPVCRAGVHVRRAPPPCKEVADLQRYQRRMQHSISRMLVRYSELYLRAHASADLSEDDGAWMPIVGSVRVVYTGGGVARGAAER